MTPREDTRNRWFLDYFMNIRYRVTQDPSQFPGLQANLDNVSSRLLSELDYINVWGPTGLTSVLTKIKNPRIEKDVGVLQYFCNITIRVKKVLPIDPKQEELEIIID